MTYDRYFGFNTTQKITLQRLLDDGVPLATTTNAGAVLKAATQAPAPWADAAAGKVQFDLLLTKLKAAGIMA